MSRISSDSILTEEQRITLIQAAITAQHYAYAPFSHYAVGAALLTTDGRIFPGCNVENSTFPATICAERSALVSAVSVGIRDFRAVAVVTRDGAYPCGICRQMMYEFAPDLQVIIADPAGKVLDALTLSELLPHGFRLNGPDGDATP